MKTNKITVVPRLRFPEFQDGGDWSFNSLERLANVVRGGSPRPIDKYMTENKNGLNWLKIGDVDKESKYITTTQDKVICSALSKTRVVKPDDLIMSNSMSFGRPYILKIESCIHDGWIAITEIDKNIDTNFLYYLILSNSSQRYFLDNAAGGGIRNLNIKIIEGLKVPFCTLPEQQKIADCLSSLDDLINAENEQLDALQEYKAGLLQQLFPAEGETTPKLRFAEFKDDGDWSTYKLNKIAKLNKERNKNERVTRVFTNSAINGIVDQQDYFKKDIANKSNLGNYYIVNKNDFIYNPRISVNAPVGPISRNKIGAGVMSPLYTVFSFTKGVSSFYEYYFQTTYWHQYLKQVSNMGARHDRMNVSVDDFKKIPLPYPNVIEQQKIADCLSSLDNLIKLQDNKVEVLKQHKQGLMQQLFPTMDGE